MKINVYGFEIGTQLIDIEAETEQKALIILIKKCWDAIDKHAKIQLLGKRDKK